VKEERKMTEAIISLLKNPEKAVEISINSREKAEKFDESWVKTQWVKLLENV